MSIRLTTLLSVLIFLAGCYYNPDIQRKAADISLALYDDPEVTDHDLQDKITVQSSSLLDLTDSVQTGRDHKLHFSLTSKNRYHFNHFIHFTDEQEVIKWNLRHEIVRELSKYRFHFQMDSLQVNVIKTEAIVPYFDGNEMGHWPIRSIRPI